MKFLMFLIYIETINNYKRLRYFKINIIISGGRKMSCDYLKERYIKRNTLLTEKNICIFDL